MFSKILLILFALSVSVVCSSRTLGPSPDNSQTEVYIVFLELGYDGDCKQYQLLLEKVIHERSPKDALVYCYKTGFAARLTDEEAEKLKGMKEIFGVVKNEIYSIDVEGY